MLPTSPKNDLRVLDAKDRWFIALWVDVQCVTIICLPEVAGSSSCFTRHGTFLSVAPSWLVLLGSFKTTYGFPKKTRTTLFPCGTKKSRCWKSQCLQRKGYPKRKSPFLTAGGLWVVRCVDHSTLIHGDWRQMRRTVGGTFQKAECPKTFTMAEDFKANAVGEKYESRNVRAIHLHIFKQWIPESKTECPVVPPTCK